MWSRTLSWTSTAPYRRAPARFSCSCTIPGDRLSHEAVTKAARNPMLADFFVGLAVPISETRHSSLGEPGRPPRSLRAHHQILEAIRRGDAPGARQAMRRHVKMVADTGLLRWAASRTAKTPTSRDARLP
jgi:DNA-binding FadR family transcriptional regulator